MTEKPWYGDNLKNGLRRIAVPANWLEFFVALEIFNLRTLRYILGIMQQLEQIEDSKKLTAELNRRLDGYLQNPLTQDEVAELFF